jgi:hypothetical protein
VEGEAVALSGHVQLSSHILVVPRTSGYGKRERVDPFSEHQHAYNPRSLKDVPLAHSRVDRRFEYTS